MNSEFEARFPEMRATLRSGATLEQVCGAFHRTGIIASDIDGNGINANAALTARTLQEGLTHQRIVHTRAGNTFDLSMFPLGTQYYATIWVDMTEVHGQQQQLASQSSELVRKN